MLKWQTLTIFTENIKKNLHVETCRVRLTQNWTSQRYSLIAQPFLFFLQWSAKTWKHTHKARRVSSNTHAYTLMRKIYPWKIYQACFSMVQNALSYLGNKVKNLIQSSLPLFYRLLFIVCCLSSWDSRWGAVTERGWLHHTISCSA